MARAGRTRYPVQRSFLIEQGFAGRTIRIEQAGLTDDGENIPADSLCVAIRATGEGILMVNTLDGEDEPEIMPFSDGEWISGLCVDRLRSTGTTAVGPFDCFLAKI